MSTQGHWLGDWSGEWLGADSGSGEDTVAGIRSPLAFWVGGASAPAPVTTVPGFRSVFAFWVGGASAVSAEVEPPAPSPGPGAAFPAVVRMDPEEELLLLLMSFPVLDWAD